MAEEGVDSEGADRRLGVASLVEWRLSRNDVGERAGHVAVSGQSSRQTERQVQGPRAEQACCAPGTARGPVWQRPRVLERGNSWR